jgi:hypothetical protein
MTTFSGEGVPVYRATALAAAIRLYRRSKMKVQRGAGPKVLLMNATSITGKAYKLTQLEQAELDLREWADRKVEGWTEADRQKYIS